MTFIHDTLTVFRRQLRRQPAQPRLGDHRAGAADPVPGTVRAAAHQLPGASTAAGPAARTAAYRYFVPGLLIQLGLFGSAFVGFAIISDWRAGVIERFRVTPVGRLAIMSGRVLRDVLALTSRRSSWCSPVWRSGCARR